MSILNAEQVAELQNSLPPTDWSKFDQKLSPTEYGRGMYQGDDKLHVRFFVMARIDVDKSNAANRPIYKDVPYIEMMIPGDKHNIVVEPVWDQHMQRFPMHWEQFRRGEQQQLVGTPLKAAPFLTPAHVADFAYMKIFTVEQLANLPDSSLGFMGAQEFKQAAKRYLDLTSGNEALMARIAALETALAAKVQAETPQPDPAAGPDYEDDIGHPARVERGGYKARK